MGDLTAIRGLDKETYRRFKARAAVEGRNVGEVMTDAMREYLRRHRDGALLAASGSLA